MSQKNIILAGLGPHARRIYYPLLEKYALQYNINLPLVIDLQSQKDKICAYLSGRKLQPENLFFVEDCYRNNETLDDRLCRTLNEIVLNNHADGIIISTEPKAHKPFALWAIDRNIDILMDKPVSAPVGAGTTVGSAQKVWQDYLEIADRLKKSNSNLIIQCQRRSHPGYRLIKSYLIDFLKEYQIPLSYLDIYHADGMWSMPPELFDRENHPYKYGYGKLMHSGYHFVDLFTWLTEVNSLVEDKKPDNVDLYVKHFGAYDFMHQINEDDYQKLFKTGRFAAFFNPARLEAAKNLGELDVFILCQLKRGAAVTTTASINLQQNSFCCRAWADLPEDIYKSNGRIRHERLNLQVANLLNIQVHSYQSHQVGKNNGDVEGAGHEDHFDIYIFRNSDLVGGKPLEKFNLGEDMRRRHAQDPFYWGHNEKARETLLLDFLEGRPSASHFATHEATNKLLSKIYECIVSEQRGGLPHLVFEI